jgi:GntR family transcriptional regulator
LQIILRPGQSIFDQVVFAAIKAFVSGQLRPGESFPSYRALAADLKIHPNTAHRVVQHLIQEQWLEARPGIGTVVAERPQPREGERQQVLGQAVEQLVVQAKRVGIGLDELQQTVSERWAAQDAAGKSKRKSDDRRDPRSRSSLPAA